MHAACADWLNRWPWRTDPGARIVPEAELRALMAQSYQAGYTDGRESTRRKPHDAPAI